MPGLVEVLCGHPEYSLCALVDSAAFLLFCENVLARLEIERNSHAR